MIFSNITGGQSMVGCVDLKLGVVLSSAGMRLIRVFFSLELSPVLLRDDSGVDKTSVIVIPGVTRMGEIMFLWLRYLIFKK